MLFNSYIFIFVFLPVTFFVFLLLKKYKSQFVINIWLIAASCFFYAWWNTPYILLLILSVLINFGIGALINAHYDKPSVRKKILIFGITCNLGVLCYYKYAGFLVNIVNDIAATQFKLGTIFLPLAISFFTLQQISYLVDAYRGRASEFNFLSYAASVTFFPHLIAGPIVRYRDLVPQFSGTKAQAFNSLDVAVGLTLFFMGLFKKIILADHISRYVDSPFAAAAAGAPVTCLEAWSACIGFVLQLYFDFSAYSDMAIGLGRIFGIRLPVNFNSPLKAVNFIDFWHRWHITLSQFIRDYLFFPLARKFRGPGSQYYITLVVMVLVGLWHGAGWTFPLWGAVHGTLLIINNLWRGMRRRWGHNFARPTWYGSAGARLLTWFFLVVSIPLFRAVDFPAALAMLKGMLGSNGMLLSQQFLEFWGLQAWIPLLTGWGFQVGDLNLLKGGVLEWLVLGLLIVNFFPNTQEILSKFDPCLGFNLGEAAGTWKWLRWRPTAPWAFLTGCLALASLLLSAKENPFLYFQF
jgi:D-alanyl-lipoteichoic acid acyltransferase DltB (MBOAT superfamily)